MEISLFLLFCQRSYRFAEVMCLRLGNIQIERIMALNIENLKKIMDFHENI